MRPTTRKARHELRAQYADKKLYVVQRLRYSPYAYPSRHDFGGYFQRKIMASWAYSGEALDDAIKKLHDTTTTPAVTYLPMVISIDGTEGVVYIVGADELLIKVWADFPVWIDEGMPAAAETDFRYAFLARYQEANTDRCSTDAWWSFNDGVMWTLDPHIADALVDTIKFLRE